MAVGGCYQEVIPGWRSVPDTPQGSFDIRVSERATQVPERLCPSGFAFVESKPEIRKLEKENIVGVGRRRHLEGVDKEILAEQLMTKLAILAHIDIWLLRAQSHACLEHVLVADIAAQAQQDALENIRFWLYCSKFACSWNLFLEDKLTHISCRSACSSGASNTVVGLKLRQSIHHHWEKSLAERRSIPILI